MLSLVTESRRALPFAADLRMSATVSGKSERDSEEDLEVNDNCSSFIKTLSSCPVGDRSLLEESLSSAEDS